MRCVATRSAAQRDDVPAHRLPVACSTTRLSTFRPSRIANYRPNNQERPGNTGCKCGPTKPRRNFEADSGCPRLLRRFRGISWHGHFPWQRAMKFRTQGPGAPPLFAPVLAGRQRYYSRNWRRCSRLVAAPHPGLGSSLVKGPTVVESRRAAHAGQQSHRAGRQLRGARGDDLLADDRVGGSSRDSALRGHDDGGVPGRQRHVPSAGISWHDHEIRSIRLSRICVRYWSTTWTLRSIRGAVSCAIGAR